MFANLLSVVTLGSLFARSVIAADCTRTYTVKEGDYCDQISKDNSVSTFQLAALNVGKYNAACTDLPIGAVLCLGALAAEDCQTIYTVKEGDTCDAISSAAGTNNTILYLNNPQIDQGCTNIYLGEVLCTANSVQVPPTPPGLVFPVGSPADNGDNGDNGDNNLPTTTTITTTTFTRPPQFYDGPTTTSLPQSEPTLPYCDEI